MYKFHSNFGNFVVVVVVFEKQNFPFSVTRITQSTMNVELTFLSSQFVCAQQFW